MIDFAEPVERFKFRPQSAVAKVVDVMRGYPVGTKLKTRELAILAGVPLMNLVSKLAIAVRSGALIHDGHSGWRLPCGEPVPVVEEEIEEVAEEAYKPRFEVEVETPEWRKLQKQFTEPIVLRGKLRDLFSTADDATTGDPMRSLVDAIDAARKVIAAKSVPGCRFAGAEVDRLVARELRQISEAAERAKANLPQALEVMA